MSPEESELQDDSLKVLNKGVGEKRISSARSLPDYKT